MGDHLCGKVAIVAGAGSVPVSSDQLLLEKERQPLRYLHASGTDRQGSLSKTSAVDLCCQRCELSLKKLRSKLE